MKKRITETRSFQGEPFAYVNVSKSSGSTMGADPSPTAFFLEHGDEALITFDPDSIPADFENFKSAKLCFEQGEFMGSPRIEFQYLHFTSEEELPEYTEAPLSEIKIDLGKLTRMGSSDSPYQIIIRCLAFNENDGTLCSFSKPRIEVTHEVEYGYTATKALPICEGADATLHLPSGKVAFSVSDIHDPVLGFSFTHYRTPVSPSRWHTNLDEMLSTSDNLYTDPLGFEHAFEERFYTTEENGEKRLMEAATSNNVKADADGRLWYENREVFRDLRTSDGLRATTRLKDINNAEWFEQRYEEEKQASEQLLALEKHLCTFVRVRENPIEISAQINPATLSRAENFEFFLENDDLLLNENEVEHFRTISLELEELEERKENNTITSEEEKQRLTLKRQLDFLLKNAEKYPEELRSRYVDYTAAKAELDTITASYPVAFLYSDDGAKGYNKSGALVTIQPKNGKPLIVMRERYTPFGERRVTSVHDESGNAMRFYYNEEGLLARVVNSLGEETVFTYEDGELHKIKRAHAPTLTFAYTGEFLTKVTEEREGTPFTQTSLSLSTTGRLMSFSRTTNVKSVFHGTVAKGSTIPLASLSLTYEEDSISLVDLLKNREEIYLFTENFVTDTYVLENGKVTSAEIVWYDEETELLLEKAVASPACLGIYPYEDFCWLSAREEIYTYNDFHECVQHTATYYAPDTEEKGHTQTQTLYNEKGHPIRVVTTHVLTATETSEEKTTVTVEEFCYNTNDDLVKTVQYTEGKEHLLGRDVEEIFYDEKGRETQRISYNSLAPSDKLYTEQRFDSLGRVEAALDETGRYETTHAYLGETQTLRAVKNARGATLAYAYDKDRREVSVTASTEDGEADTESVYYTASLPVCSTNGRHVFNYTYDGKGRVTKIHLDGLDYLGHVYTENEDGTDTVTTAYAGFESIPLSVTSDKFGKVKSRTRPGIKDVSYTYTHDGRIQGEIDSISGREKSYGYDERFRLTRYTDTHGVTETLTYDAEDRVIERTEALEENAVTTNFVYDEDTERLSRMTVKDFSILPFFDPMGRESKRTVWKNGDFLHGEYTAFAKYGDHATVRPSLFELATRAETHRLKYTYDTLGNIEKIFENGILSSRYEYDALGRLTREDNRAFGKTSLWEYDKSGNILSRNTYAFTTKSTEELRENTPIDTLLYGYAGDHLISLNGVENIQYSAEGHPGVYRGKALAWLAPRMLGSYDGKALTYNADGLCASIDGKPLTYSRDGRLLSDGTFRYLYDEKGCLLGFLRAADGAEYLYRRDALGNIIAILDTTGNIVVQYKYNAWGEHIVLDASGEVITDQNHIGNLNPHRYRGYYYSTELKLYYLTSRFYDPEIGRFICADSLDYLDPHTIGGLNLYAYCNNNPVMNVDPTGHWSWETFWEGVSMVAVAVTAIAISVATLGAATPVAITAVAVVTATVGALTGINGVATIVEAATDYNVVKDVVFQGNEAAYDTYASITEGVAALGTAVLGVYNSTGYAKAVRAGKLGFYFNYLIGERNDYNKRNISRTISKCFCPQFDKTRKKEIPH